LTHAHSALGLLHAASILPSSEFHDPWHTLSQMCHERAAAHCYAAHSYAGPPADACESDTPGQMGHERTAARIYTAHSYAGPSTDGRALDAHNLTGM